MENDSNPSLDPITNLIFFYIKILKLFSWTNILYSTSFLYNYHIITTVLLTHKRSFIILDLSKSNILSFIINGFYPRWWTHFDFQSVWAGYRLYVLCEVLTSIKEKSHKNSCYKNKVSLPNSMVSFIKLVFIEGLFSGKIKDLILYLRLYQLVYQAWVDSRSIKTAVAEGAGDSL